MFYLKVGFSKIFRIISLKFRPRKLPHFCIHLCHSDVFFWKMIQFFGRLWLKILPWNFSHRNFAIYYFFLGLLKDLQLSDGTDFITNSSWKRANLWGQGWNTKSWDKKKLNLSLNHSATWELLSWGQVYIEPKSGLELALVQWIWTVDLAKTILHYSLSLGR